MSEDLRGYLGDVAAQHQAEDALLWIRRSDAEVFVPVAWNHDGEPPGASWGTDKQRALIAWAAGEGVVTFEDDAGTPTLAAARVPMQAVGEFTEHEHAVGALVLYSSDGIGAGRGDVKLWLPRHAERLAQLVELQVTRNEVARQNRRFRVLMRNARDVREAPAQGEQQALEKRIAESAVEATGAAFAALVRWNPELRRGVIRHTTGSYPSPAPAAEDPVDADSLVGSVCIGGTQLVWEDAALMAGDEPLYSRSLASVITGSLAILPLARGPANIGAIVIGAREAHAFRPNDLRTARLLSQLAASALEAEWEIEEVSRRSRTDQLTGLGNRRHFDAELLRVLNETDRFGHGCALILGDVDHFKLVNDTYGHEAGDLVLRTVAAVIRDLVRTTDIVARVGGEEFCAILPQTGMEGATELAERLRVSIAEARVPWRDGEIAATARSPRRRASACRPTRRAQASAPFCSRRRTGPCTMPRKRGETASAPPIELGGRRSVYFTGRGRLVSIVQVAPWQRAQVLGSLVKHSGNSQLRTTTSLWLHKASALL